MSGEDPAGVGDDANVGSYATGELIEDVAYEVGGAAGVTGSGESDVSADGDWNSDSAYEEYSADRKM